MIHLKQNYRSRSISWWRGSSETKQPSRKHLKRSRRCLTRRLAKIWRPQLSGVHKTKASLGIMVEMIPMSLESVQRSRSFKCDHQVVSLAILPMIVNLPLKLQRRWRRKARRRKMMTKRKLLCKPFKKFQFTCMKVKWKKRKEVTLIHYSSSRWDPRHSITQGRPRTEARSKKNSENFPNKRSKTNSDKASKQRRTPLSLYQRRCHCNKAELIPAPNPLTHHESCSPTLILPTTLHQLAASNQRSHRRKSRVQVENKPQ